MWYSIEKSKLHSTAIRLTGPQIDPIQPGHNGTWGTEVPLALVRGACMRVPRRRLVGSRVHGSASVDGDDDAGGSFCVCSVLRYDRGAGRRARLDGAATAEERCGQGPGAVE